MALAGPPSTLEDLLLQSAVSLNLNLDSSSLASSHAIDYLAHLSSLPLPSLSKEPLQLEAISNQLESDLSLLCFREFKTFLLANHAILAIRNAFQNLNHSLDRFLSNTSQLDLLSQNFKITVQPILSDRNQIALLLDHLGSIEDLLELPHLVSTCISARLWNEAIDLGLRVRELDLNMSPHQHSSRHHTSVGVLKRIRIEVDRTLMALRDNLLNGLRDVGLKLPLAVRTIIVLRRMSTLFSHSSSPGIRPLSEPELRMAFLASRWHCFSDTLQQLELATGFFSVTAATPALSQLELFADSALQLNEDRLKFLRRWVELWRELVGDTLSIYFDIFLAPASASFHRLTHPAPAPLECPPQFLTDPETPLNVFLSAALDRLLSTLEHHLSLTVSVSSLASILTQLSYCGAAFGRWGMDLTGTAAPLVVARVEQVIALRMHAGLRQLQAELKPILASTPTSSPFTRTGFQTRRRSLRPLSAGPAAGIEACLVAPDAQKQVLKLPPAELAAPDPETLHTRWLCLFPPLARFVNAQFVALNELRLLPAVSAYAPVAGAQLDVLVAGTEEMRKIVLSVPEDQPGLGVETGQADEEDRSTSQLRTVVERMMLVWCHNVIVVLERSLRVGVYGELGLDEPSERLRNLVRDCESLLNISPAGAAPSEEATEKETENVDSTAATLQVPGAGEDPQPVVGTLDAEPSIAVPVKSSEGSFETLPTKDFVPIDSSLASQDCHDSEAQEKAPATPPPESQEPNQPSTVPDQSESDSALEK